MHFAPQRHAGFTLIEVLVAITVMALMSLMAWRGLDGMLRSQSGMQQRADDIRTLQAELGGKSKLCAVLKADAYGHGIGLVMPSIIAQGVPCVAVASNEEARVVRASGFTGQLVRVRAASLSELEDALQYDMEELVGSAEFARQADAIAARHGKTLRIHLAFNSSGMSRNGVEMATWSGRGEALQITDQKHLKLVALMTHFAVEDKDDVRKGLAAFNQQARPKERSPMLVPHNTFILVADGRKQLVGLRTVDPSIVLEEGAQIVANPNQPKPMTMLGHVTSSYWSENLGRSIAIAMVAGGRGRMGETLYVPMKDKTIAVEVTDMVFVDKEGGRIHG